MTDPMTLPAPMVRMEARAWWAALAAAAVLWAAAPAEGTIGVNLGTTMSHQMLPKSIVETLKDNGIKKVKLFDADDWTVSALAGSGIEVMLAIPNDQLSRMNDYDNAQEWVKENVTRYHFKGGVNIKYVAVGNEPFLKSYNGSFLHTTLPALKNIQKALDEAGVGKEIKATVPLNADVYDSPPSNPVPSGGNFRSDIRGLMVDVVKFLHANDAPFVVNIYPFLSLYANDDFPLDFAFFDGGGRAINDNDEQYTNVFDANFDTLVWSLKKSGVPNLKIVVGEIGWPTDGDKHATVDLAKRFYDGLFKKLAKNEGTPLRPGDMDVYLFGLLDEDQKSVAPGNFERHWGILYYDGKPKFPMDLTGKGNDKFWVPVKGVQYLPAQWCVFNDRAKDLKGLADNVNYACANGDCTALGYGCSCGDLDSRGNISYAFNMYFQMQDQDVMACDFDGLAKITQKNASQGSCLFPVQILSASQRTTPSGGSLSLLLATVAALMLTK
ncbi:hypothetical protein Taro_054129 [Colocasia esculenta]|uniref:glucan endo-1,3-beta-D-glucosidase n=1 Tax=Colocasia esculenta TaxID=4460 RepID=A0A843XP44_COLES|nr:hypothetical protein [Colocasia esculenta]